LIALLRQAATTQSMEGKRVDLSLVRRLQQLCIGTVLG
jgi:hypothetical protein